MQYDTRGNVVSLGDQAHKTELGYDISDRNIRIASGEKETTYVRDSLDRIVMRTVTENGSITEQVKYGFTDDEDAPSFTLDQNDNVSRAYLTLPGGVTVTVNPSSTSAGALTYSLPNIHGDVMATVNADGMLIGRYMTGPFGESLTVNPASINAGSPNNTGAENASMKYLGKHQKITDTATTPIADGIVQMGARPYVPILGRFVSVDPVDGGTDNNYVYPTDPVNSFDTNGEFFWVGAQVVIRVVVHFAAKQAAKKAAQEAAKRAAQQAAKRAAEAARKRAAHAFNKMISATSNKIARGHAFKKHAHQFGIRSVSQFEKHISNAIRNANRVKYLDRGRVAYWHESTKTLVIRDINSRDMGTAFKTTLKYFNRLN